MPWTNPKTWFDGEHVGAVELNLHLRDNLNELRRGCISVANETARTALTAVPAGQLVWQADIGELLVYDGVFWREVVLGSEDFAYETLSMVASSGALLYGNNTTMVDTERVSSGDNWDVQVYSTNGWVAPVTIEFVAFANTGDNTRSYFMLGLDPSPTTNASFDAIDYAAYPFNQSGYEVYHNGSNMLAQASGVSFSSSDLFRIVYDTAGRILHYNGSKLLYSVSTGSATTTRYLDMSLNRTGHGPRRIRAIRKTWNGYSYV